MHDQKNLFGVTTEISFSNSIGFGVLGFRFGNNLIVINGCTITTAFLLLQHYFRFTNHKKSFIWTTNYNYFKFVLQNLKKIQYKKNVNIIWKCWRPFRRNSVATYFLFVYTILSILRKGLSIASSFPSSTIIGSKGLPSLEVNRPSLRVVTCFLFSRVICLNSYWGRAFASTEKTIVA